MNPPVLASDYETGVKAKNTSENELEEALQERVVVHMKTRECFLCKLEQPIRTKVYPQNIKN
jgi:hypothetical protein